MKTLRAKTPLEAYTEGLKDASPEAIKDWIRLCNEVAGKYMEADAEEVPVSKETKSKRATTNASGPAEWNVFVRATWHEMAALKGVVIEDYDADTKEAAEKAFKKAAAAVGVTYQAAMKEASRRKAELEGSMPKVKKTKAAKDTSGLAELKAKVAAATEAKATESKAKGVRVAIEHDSESDSEDKSQLAAAAEMGWEKKVIEGKKMWYDPKDHNCFSYPDGNDQLGIYDPDDESFVPSE